MEDSNDRAEVAKEEVIAAIRAGDATLADDCPNFQQCGCAVDDQAKATGSGSIRITVDITISGDNLIVVKKHRE